MSDGKRIDQAGFDRAYLGEISLGSSGFLERERERRDLRLQAKLLVPFLLPISALKRDFWVVEYGTSTILVAIVVAVVVVVVVSWDHRVHEGPS